MIDRIESVIKWWKRQHWAVKILTLVFIVVVIVLLLVAAVFSRRSASESGTLDVAVDLYDKEMARREGKLLEIDSDGEEKVEKANSELRRLGEEGMKASDDREKRDSEIHNADAWSDLDGELGSARNSGRKGTR